MANYFINKDMTQNPGFHHEIHKAGSCHVGNSIPMSKRVNLGYQSSDTAALAAAKQYYNDADGCVHCCPSIHRG